MKSNLFFCRYSLSPLRKEPSDSSEMVSQVQFGEVIELLEEREQWHKIRQLKDNYEGWLDRKFLSPLTEKEVIKWLDQSAPSPPLTVKISHEHGTIVLPKGSFLPIDSKELNFNIGPNKYQFQEPLEIETLTLSEIVESYLGAPYLWGGKSPFGIDCSGLTQMVFRFVDINLPRDAFQQFEHGQDIDFEDKTAGDLVFFINSNKHIHHVGILVGGNEIVHAHGCVRKDTLSEKGIISSETGLLTHKFHQIKRV
ncbi:MAG: C40 family peptidase [Bacteroidetes bacterium]|nr:C40 family peptidase [Bacteroidota bacterium]